MKERSLEEEVENKFICRCLFLSSSGCNIATLCTMFGYTHM